MRFWRRPPESTPHGERNPVDVVPAYLLPRIERSWPGCQRTTCAAVVVGLLFDTQLKEQPCDSFRDRRRFDAELPRDRLVALSLRDEREQLLIRCLEVSDGAARAPPLHQPRHDG